MIKMKPEIKEKWIKALPNYKQGRGFLRIDDKYCCLGVLCDIYSKETGIPWNRPYKGAEYDFMGAMSFLPPSVIHWAGLTSLNPTVIIDGKKRCLSELNDGVDSEDEPERNIQRYSPDEMTKVIEEQL